MTSIRPEPCDCCPYRRDVPSGVWAASEYAKLPAYDKPTGEQPPVPVMCHAMTGRYCYGWAVCHSTRGREYELLALRLYPPENYDLPFGHQPAQAQAGQGLSQTGLFASGAAAAEHGLRDVQQPGPQAVRAMRRLRTRYPRLR